MNVEEIVILRRKDLCKKSIIFQGNSIRDFSIYSMNYKMLGQDLKASNSSKTV